jgi:restriction system protein
VRHQRKASQRPSSTAAADPAKINKYQIARTVLTRLNEQGDASLRQRREVLKSIVEFEDFSICWPNDRLKAKGLVQSIQATINAKDAFTRMNKSETLNARPD